MLQWDIGQLFVRVQFFKVFGLVLIEAALPERATRFRRPRTMIVIDSPSLKCHGERQLQHQ
jgi:hypothetical protein